MSFIWGDKTSIADIIKANQEPTYIVPVDLIESSEHIDALQAKLDAVNGKLAQIRALCDAPHKYDPDGRGILKRQIRVILDGGDDYD